MSGEQRARAAAAGVVWFLSAMVERRTTQHHPGRTPDYIASAGPNTPPSSALSPSAKSLACSDEILNQQRNSGHDASLEGCLGAQILRAESGHSAPICAKSPTTPLPFLANLPHTSQLRSSCTLRLPRHRSLPTPSSRGTMLLFQPLAAAIAMCFRPQAANPDHLCRALSSSLLPPLHDGGPRDTAHRRKSS